MFLMSVRTFFINWAVFLLANAIVSLIAMLVLNNFESELIGRTLSYAQVYWMVFVLRYAATS